MRGEISAFRLPGADDGGATGYPRVLTHPVTPRAIPSGEVERYPAQGINLSVIWLSL